MSETPTANVRARSRWLRTIAFAVGFSMMTVELLSGRLIAPYLGNSLYTWTAVLASVLVGVALGSWLGGRVSEGKGLFTATSVWLFLSATVLTLVIFVVVPIVGPFLEAQSWPLSVLSLVFSVVVFLPPSVTLSVAMPLLVKRDVRELSASGARYGELAAWNAAGSILGTYVTGFLFIGYVQTPHVIVGVTLLLVLLSGAEALLKKRFV